MRRLTDMMTPEDRALVKKWTDEQQNSPYKRDIPLSVYIAAQLGTYFGWQAVESFIRGYFTGIDHAGRPERISFTSEDAVALIKGAKKVRYRQILDEGRIDAAMTNSVTNKSFCNQNAKIVNKIIKETNQD